MFGAAKSLRAALASGKARNADWRFNAAKGEFLSITPARFSKERTF
jgi:hypothetical protein